MRINKFIQLFLFICLPVLSYADVGVSYCMEATVFMQNGTVQRGHFYLGTHDLYLKEDAQGFYYSRQREPMRLQSVKETRRNGFIYIKETDYHFHRYVKRLLGDSVRLYPSAVLIYKTIDSDTVSFPAFVGKPVAVFWGDIKDITIHRIAFAGLWANTRCEMSDLSWLNSSRLPSNEPLCGTNYCDYQTFLFERNKEKVAPLLDKLKKYYREYDEDLDDAKFQMILETIEALRKEHVLIASFCSC